MRRSESETTDRRDQQGGGHEEEGKDHVNRPGGSLFVPDFYDAFTDIFDEATNFMSRSIE